ncbi:MAG: hypothetical protein M1835_003505, partial [Candelina submexicana]
MHILSSEPYVSVTNVNQIPGTSTTGRTFSNVVKLMRLVEATQAFVSKILPRQSSATSGYFAPATIDKGILPSTLGLSQLYYLLYWEFFTCPGSMIWAEYYGLESSGTTYYESEALYFKEIPALFRALTGLPMLSGMRKDTSAIAANGLCIYYKAFYQIDCPLHDVCSIGVIPGHIENNNGIFRNIADLPPEWLEESPSIQDPNADDDATACLNLNWDLVVRETEHSDSLEAAIAFRDLSLKILEWLPLCHF